MIQRRGQRLGGEGAGKEVGLGVAHVARVDQRVRRAALRDAVLQEVQQRVGPRLGDVGVAEHVPGAVEIPGKVGPRGRRQGQVAADRGRIVLFGAEPGEAQRRIDEGRGEARQHLLNRVIQRCAVHPVLG